MCLLLAELLVGGTFTDNSLWFWHCCILWPFWNESWSSLFFFPKPIPNQLKYWIHHSSGFALQGPSQGAGLWIGFWENANGIYRHRVTNDRGWLKQLQAIAKCSETQEGCCLSLARCWLLTSPTHRKGKSGKHAASAQLAYTVHYMRQTAGHLP